jgi:hypothetical protein
VLAAVDRQGRAGDEAGILAAQEGDAARDLLGLAEPADRDRATILPSTSSGTAATMSVSI